MNIYNALNRRDFLRTGLPGATLLASAPLMRGAQKEKRQAQLNRLACNSWPFRAYFDTPQLHEYRDPNYPLLTQWEFPEFLADHFQIHNVEFLPQHFVDTNAATIDKVKRGLKKASSRCCNLMGVEIPGGVFAGGASRETVTKEAERWVGVALALGSPTVTVALTGKGPADPHAAAKNLQPFVDIAYARGIKVLFHNDNLQLESAETLTSVMKELGHDRTGACPDFGNFATKSAAFALAQLRMLAPFATNICHAKDGIAADGKFYPDDFAASMRVMSGAGFMGVYSLEFEGLGAPLEGVRHLKDLTERYLE